MLTLYLARNTIAVASHIALREAGLDHTLAWVDFAAAEQRGPDYLAINPKGRVPALVTAQGVLTETPAILRYVAALAPGLAPADPWGLARCDEWLAWLASTMHVNHAHKMRGYRWTPDTAAHAALTAHVPVTMADSAAHVERHLPPEGWALGTYSVADMHLFAICRWLGGDGVDVSAYPRLAAHMAAMRARPAVAQVEAMHG